MTDTEKNERKFTVEADDAGEDDDIAPEEVVCFGDDEPDVGMLRTFGCGIAMANATAAAKSAADHVTRSNNESGIAHALRNHLGMA